LLPVAFVAAQIFKYHLDAGLVGLLLQLVISSSQKVDMPYTLHFFLRSEDTMPRVAPLKLDDHQRACLKAIVKKGVDWRERDRAETLLLLADVKSIAEVADHQGLCLEAVRVRRRKWLKSGLASLPDLPRCGAPNKLADAHRQRLREWVEKEPLTVRQLLTRLVGEYPVAVSANTLRNELKQLGYVWKRTRYSLKKNGIPSDSTRPAARSTP